MILNGEITDGKKENKFSCRKFFKLAGAAGFVSIVA